MRALATLLAIGAATVLTASVSGATGRTELRIAYRENGRMPTPTTVWTLRCDPTGGTLPRSARACTELARVGRAAFRPVPPETACTEIYGGPQTVIVTGTVGGQRVWTKLRRENGCEISRWDRVRFLIPAKPGVR